MATVVFFHAHPDDEVLFTGGTMARAADEGHRVVLVTATMGEQGVDRAGVVASGGSVGARREQELAVAAARLGVDRSHLLGYLDSGRDGGVEGGFSRAPGEEAATRLAAILSEEAADVLVTYDERGIYEHPDHVQVHRVGLRAAGLVDLESVFLATVDRDRVQALLAQAAALGLTLDEATLDWAVSAGVAPERITTVVDVTAYLDVKRHALAAHATQFPPGSSVFELPSLAFEALFGTEYYIALGERRPATWLWEP
jgi:LmbE family N-acetylglucosaminyl deacetylase